MRRTLIHLILSISTLAPASFGRAADAPELTPLTAEPILTMPAPVGPQPVIVGMGFYRPNRLDVWQNLAVGQNGLWRPRVALFGHGAYYPNGMPYGLLPVRQMDLMPYLLD
jgi:hypothetical protein